MNVTAYLWVFCALAYLESAGYVHRLHRKSGLNRVSALLLLWIAGYSLLLSFTASVESQALARTFTKLHIVSSAFIGPLSLHFLLVISRHDALTRKPHILAAIYFVPVLFSVITFADPGIFARLYHTRWGWDLLPDPHPTAWPYLYFFYACIAMAVGFGVVVARAFSTRDRLEKRQMTAIACFTVVALVNSVVISLLGKSGSAPRDASDASALSANVASLASLGVWLGALRFTNWRFKLLVRLPETFAGDLLSSMSSPFFLVDRDNVITFANRGAALALGNGGADDANAMRLEGMHFHDLFKNRDLLIDCAKRLRDRATHVEACLALAPPDGAPFQITMLPIINEQDAYVGGFVMAKTPGGLEEIRKRAHLTSRELEIILLLDQGFRTKEISAALFISELTAKTHIHNIYQKVGARSRVELSKLVRD